jgi:prenyltransferase beta subunit
MYEDVRDAEILSFPTSADVARSNIRGRHLGPARCRGTWCIRLLCSRLPLSPGCPLSHHSQVSCICSRCTPLSRRGRTALIMNAGRVLDVPRLLSWLSSRQYAPEGGFSGRTNKLVDGCYSHWVGACWPLVEACLEAWPSPAPGDADEQQCPVVDLNSLYDREGLIRYIMTCGQDHSSRGGMRDKPSR